MRAYLKRADLFLLAICIISSLYGLVVVWSATLSYESPRYVIVQALAIVLGVIAYLVITVIDVDVLAGRWPLLSAFSVLFMGSLLIFGETSDTGNQAWIRFLGIGIQPAEIVKLSFIIVLAKQIVYLRDYKNLNSLGSAMQLAGHFIGIFGVLLVTSQDLGSALVYFFIFIVMLFAGGFKLHWFAIGFAAIAAIMPIVWNYFLADYQKDRILVPYFPEIDPTGYGVSWQATQSKLALASGRLTGTGLGQGVQSQSATAIFSKESDFIFAVIGEELGMIGCLAVIALLSVIIIRCVVIGLRSGNTLSMLVCVGVAATITFQTFENVGMCVGIAPVVGITLPFFSYGGSSIVATFAAMGLVSGVRYKTRRRI